MCFNEHQDPIARALFAKQNSAPAMMLTSRLTVEAWWCSNANQAGTLLPVCLSTLPTAVDANEAHGQSFAIFCGESSFRLTNSFASAKFKKKERGKFPQYQPLVVPFKLVVIDSSEHDRPSVLSKELFEPGQFFSRPKLLKVGLHVHTFFSRFQVQSNEKLGSTMRRFRKRWRRPQILHFCGDDRRIRSMHVLIRPRLLPYTSIVPTKLQDLRPSPSFTKSSIATSCHMPVRDSNFTQSEVLRNTKNGTLLHQLWQSGMHAVRIRTSRAFWGTWEHKNGT